jgi:predicted ferric reductase
MPARPPYLAGDLIIAVLALLPLVVSVPVILSSPPETAAGGLRAAGRVTGVVGLAWLFLAAVFAVRIPGLDRPFGGLVRLWRIHHVLGSGAFLLLLAHPVLLALAALPVSPAAASAVMFPPAGRWAVWVGWGALLAMMAFLAPTYSFFGKTEYQRWKWLHLLSGVAILLGLAHALPLATTPGHPWAMLLWVLLGGLALGAFAWRAVLSRTVRKPYRITRVERPASRVVELSLRPEGGDVLRYAPGQFVYLAPLDPALAAGRNEEHPYTLSSAPHEPELRIAIKSLGDASAALQTVSAGSRAWIEGPYGRFFPDRSQAPELWIGAGIGVTPFLSRLRALAHSPEPADIRFVYCAQDESRAYFLPEILQLAGCLKNVEVVTHYFAARGPLDRDFLAAQVPDFARRTAFVCGPLPLMNLTVAILRDAGVPRAHIHTEEFNLL